MSETTPLWRVLAMHAGSNADAVDALTFFGIERERILAPYVVRRVAKARCSYERVRKNGHWRYVKPTGVHVAPLFAGYVFVRCDDPVACGSVDWSVKGRGALLRPEPLAAPTVIANAWIDALAGLCRRDSRDRMLIDADAVAGLSPGRDVRAVLHRAFQSGELARVRMISGAFEGEIVQLEPVIGPAALVDALRLLDERGLVRIVLSMFGSRRTVAVPREQVEVIGECMPSHA